MRVQQIFDNSVKFLKANSPEILTALGVSGVITTSYLAGKAAFKAAEVVSSGDQQGGFPEDPKERQKEIIKQTWRLYIPAGLVGGFTIGCIVGAQKSGSNKTTAAVAAYSLTERAFAEYKEKVVEQIGLNQEQKVRDGIVQDKVEAKPHTSQEVIIIGKGDVLCCELYTHRYFRSDMETLRKAQNQINSEIVNSIYVTLDEFYDEIGLPHTSVSSEIGWNCDKLMELQFSTVLSEGGEPCLAFDYNYVKPID